MPVSIYRGLPKELSPVETPQLGLNFWLLILLASSALLLVFIFIFIFVRYWSSGNKKVANKTFFSHIPCISSNLLLSLPV